MAAAQVLHSVIWFVFARFVAEILRSLLLDMRATAPTRQQPQTGLLSRARSRLSRLKPRTSQQKAKVYLLLFLLVTPFNTPTPFLGGMSPFAFWEFVLPPLASVRGLLLCALFVVLIFVAGNSASKVSDEPEAGSLWRRLLAEAPVFLTTVLASIVIAGAQDPQLPAVKLDSREETEGHYYLLAHQGDYWYLFNMGGELSAIHHDEAGEVRFLHDTPTSSWSLRASENGQNR